MSLTPRDRTAVIILAAGTSQRFGQDKLLVDLGDKPLISWSLETLGLHPEIGFVVLVTSKENLEIMSKIALDSKVRAQVIEGGNSRQESVLCGLKALPEHITWVLIHDGARPFLSLDLVSNVVACVRENGTALPCIPVVDTIKQIHADGSWTTPNRANLRAAQTPQAALREDLLRAYETCEGEFTDDFSLLEKLKIYPKEIAGERGNYKVTEPFDYEVAIMQMSQLDIRTGMGYDIHAFSTDQNRKMVLGGVEFPGVIGLDGHSDADVLLHAVTDAILGAVGLGDIGQLFPNDDPAHKNRDSREFLRIAALKLQELRWKIVHIDATVIAELPKIGPVSELIRKNIAIDTGLEMESVSVKATTNEGLGSIGRKEGIAAMAVATVCRTLGKRTS